MKKTIALALVCALCATPSAFATTRTLTCSRGANQVQFGICGISGCVGSVVNNGGRAINYNLRRTKATSGALTYTPARNASRRCTFGISALSRGVRRITNTPTCSTGLRGASCVFVDQE